jgi:hypothetical protein
MPPKDGVPLRLTRWEMSETDTLSVWVAAAVQSAPLKQGETPSIIAADSVLHSMRFARVGEIPMVDTVRLTLRRI